MKYPPGVPDWPGPEDPERLLRTPKMPPLLLYRGVHSLETGQTNGLTWTCCSTYRVSVDGGGLAAEHPLDPEPHAPGLQPIAPWGGIEELTAWMGVDTVEAFVNPLAWPNLSAIITRGRGPRGCVRIGDYTVSGTILTPLRPTRPETDCRDPGPPAGPAEKMGPFRLPRPSRSYRAGETVIVDYDGCMGVVARGTLTLIGDCQLELETPYLEYRLGVLAGAGFYEERGRRARLEAHALWIGLEKYVAIASRWGLQLEAEPGRLLVESRGTLRLGVGQSLIAYRLLVEDAVDWSIVRAPGRGLGHARASGTVGLLAGAGRGWIEYAVLNPGSGPGVFEARLPFRGEEARIRGPLGEVGVPVEGDLVRVPAPLGYVGSVRVGLAAKKLWLLRLSGRRG